MRRKDRYIGRLYWDIGKVPSDSGIFRSTGELREFAGEYMGLIGRQGKERGEAARPPRPSPNWTRGRGCAPSFLLFSSPLRETGSTDVLCTQVTGGCLSLSL